MTQEQVERILIRHLSAWLKVERQDWMIFPLAARQDIRDCAAELIATLTPLPVSPAPSEREYTAHETAQRLRHLADHAVKGAEWIHTPLSKLYRRAADLLDTSEARQKGTK